VAKFSKENLDFQGAEPLKGYLLDLLNPLKDARSQWRFKLGFRMKNVLILVVSGIHMGCLEQVGGMFPTYSLKRNAIDPCAF